MRNPGNGAGGGLRAQPHACLISRVGGKTTILVMLPSSGERLRGKSKAKGQVFSFVYGFPSCKAPSYSLPYLDLMRIWLGVGHAFPHLTIKNDKA